MLATATTPRQRAETGFQAALSRAPSAEELDTLTAAYGRARHYFQEDPAAAAVLSAIGNSPQNPLLDAVELAACLTVANTLLNLDEFVTDLWVPNLQSVSYTHLRAQET